MNHHVLRLGCKRDVFYTGEPSGYNLLHCRSLQQLVAAGLLEVSLNYNLINFVKLVKLVKKYLTLTKTLVGTEPSPMPNQIGHRAFCVGCASKNQQFHVLLCITGFVKFS